MVIASGTVALTGGKHEFGAGAVTGAGTLALEGGTTIFDSGVALSEAGLSVAGSDTVLEAAGLLPFYTGRFSEGLGATISIKTGGALGLGGSASFAGGTVNGAGRLHTLGGTTITGGFTIGQKAVFENGGTVRQSAIVTLGDSCGFAVSLRNDVGATYAIADDSGIALGNTAKSTVINAGLLEKIGGTGISTVAVSLTDTGSLAVASGTLALTGATTIIAGAVTGAGTLSLAGGTTTLAGGATLSVSTLSLTGSDTSLDVTGNVTDLGNFSEAAGAYLGVASGETFTSAGTANSLVGSVGGAGGLALSVGVTTVASSTSIETSSLVNGASLIKSAGTDTSVIAALFSNHGSVEAASGTLDFAGAVIGTGTFKADAGDTLEFGASVATGSAVTLNGTGATLQVDHSAAAGSAFSGTVAGLTASNALDLRDVSFLGASTTKATFAGTSSGGTLTVTDGTHSSAIALVGNYLATTFLTATDNHGGRS